MINMKIRSVEELGEAIRTRRKELHYTQAFLAEFTGFSVSFISDVERGKATAVRVFSDGFLYLYNAKHIEK